MQTVVVDIRANHDTGVARYGQSMLTGLVPQVADHGLRLVVVTRPMQLSWARSIVASAPSGHVHVEACPDDEGFMRRSPWVRDIIRTSRADLFFTTHYLVDRDCPIPFVFTIHDLTRLRFPEVSYTDESFAARFGEEQLALLKVELTALSLWDEPSSDGAGQHFTRYFRALNRYLAERATRIVTVSKASAYDVHSILGVPEERISLVPGAVDRGTFHPRPASSVIGLQERHRIDGPYCLYVGLTHPHKRFVWLVQSLLERRAGLPRGARLVAVGGHAERTPGIQQLIARLRGQDFVVFTGRVTDDELAGLYSGASALLIASLNEGGAQSALEALACGSEVVATDIPPLRETLGPSAHFYPVTDPDALTSLAAAALSGRLERYAPSFTPFTWKDAGVRLAAALRIALGEARTIGSGHPPRAMRRGGSRSRTTNHARQP